MVQVLSNQPLLSYLLLLFEHIAFFFISESHTPKGLYNQKAITKNKSTRYNHKARRQNQCPKAKVVN